MLASTLGRLAAGQDLSMTEMSDAIGAVMEGKCTPGEIGLLLTGLRLKGETVEEVAGAAAAMRRHMTPIRHKHQALIDTCGTGGDGSGTFNISTAAALVTAAAGVPVAKHGNRGITSKSGSADVLTHLGVNIDADVPIVEACLNELGICFCFAPRLHPAMKHVAEVRKQLGVPTIFNMLGPLTNPASAPFQIIGVGRAELRPLLAQALSLLGTRRALVVRGDDGLDEVSLAGPTRVSEVVGKDEQHAHEDVGVAPDVVGEASVLEFSWRPEQFGIAPASHEALRIASPAESAAMIQAVLDGRPGPPRDITILNSAAALWTVGKSGDLRTCAQLAAAAIDSGAARELLGKLAERTQL